MRAYYDKFIMNGDFMTVKDLREILNALPEDMLIVMPVVDQNDVNYIYGFLKIGTAGILVCEAEEEREVFCLNVRYDGKDLSYQVQTSGVNAYISVKEILYGLAT